jgi:oxygen-independent coproporphyrinogen-3 oxidase
MRLMCDMALSFESLSEETGVNLSEYLAGEIEALDPLEQDGLLERTWEGFDVTPAGRLLVRNIAMTFDPYLVESRARYSRTV